MVKNLGSKLLRLEIVQIAAALGMFVAPWSFGFADHGPAAWSAWITAAITVVFASLLSINEPGWSGVGTLAAGLWAVLAPFVLGFGTHLGALWSHIAVGTVVTLAAITTLTLTPGRATHPA